MTYAQLASPEDGISYANNAVTGTTTTTTTTPAAGGTSLAGGSTCATRVSWPLYGSSNKYLITFTDDTTPQYFESDSTSRTITITYNGVAIAKKGFDASCNQMGAVTYLNGMTPSLGTVPTKFSLTCSTTTFPYVLEIWLV
jgi:hypothetical protein